MVTLAPTDLVEIDRKRRDAAVALLNDVAVTGNAVDDRFDIYFHDIPGGKTTRKAILHGVERFVIRMLRSHPRETVFELDTATWWDKPKA